LEQDWCSRAASSAACRQIAKDDDFVLFSVTIFKKTKDEFLQKSREAKFIARDFTYDSGAVEAGRKELERAQREERELYVSAPA
jgi:V-type H+-transporting ATPase subunit C